MNIFKTFENELSYKDGLQLDGTFAVAHINYDKSPIFNEVDSKYLAKNSRKTSLSSVEKFLTGIYYIGQKSIYKHIIQKNINSIVFLKNMIKNT